MPRRDLQYLDLTDFTAGIHGSWFGDHVPQAPVGAAQVPNTYGCYGHPNGGLVPLPKLLTTRTGDLIDSNKTGNRVINGDTTEHITDILCISPYYSLSFLSLARLTSTPEQIHVGRSYWYDSSNSNDYKIRSHWTVEKRGLSGSPTVTLNDTTSTTWSDVSASDTSTRIRANQFMFNRGYGSLTSEGVPYTVIGSPYVANIGHVTTTVPSSGTYSISTYPDLENQTVDTPVRGVGTSGAVPSILVGHQTRLVAFGLDTNVIGANSGALFTNEYIHYSKPNAPYSQDTVGDLWSSENSSGYGTVASISANELFLVKRTGGGLVVRGSLANPTVVRLQNISSTGEITSNGAVTPNGYVYLSDSGVHMWSNGQTSQHISPQFEGPFFMPDDSTNLLRRESFMFRLGLSYPFVFCPNNYVLDLRTMGWFRLDDPSDDQFCYYSPTYDGRMYCAPSAIASDGDTLWKTYDCVNGQLRSDYTWQSQPLPLTRGRITRLRELILVTEGTGTVTLTVTGLDGNTSVHAVSVSSDEPEVAVVNIDLECYDPYIRIQSAHSSSGVAPRVHRVRLGYYEDRETAPV